MQGLFAFFTTLAWAVILYPAIKRLKKTWFILLGWVILLSVLSLALKAIVNKSLVPLAFFWDAAGIFFASAVISLWFNYKSRTLEELSEHQVDLTVYKTKNRLHLRYLFEVGVKIEEQGRIFYNTLSDLAINPEVKQLCTRLSGEELAHKKILQNELSRWLAIEFDKNALAAIEEELRQNGFFANFPALDAGEAEMVKYAIGQEKMMAGFYLSFEKSFPQQWKAMHIQFLVMQERKHASDLVALYPQFKNLIE